MQSHDTERGYTVRWRWEDPYQPLAGGGWVVVELDEDGTEKDDGRVIELVDALVLTEDRTMIDEHARNLDVAISAAQTLLAFVTNAFELDEPEPIIDPGSPMSHTLLDAADTVTAVAFDLADGVLRDGSPAEQHGQRALRAVLVSEQLRHAVGGPFEEQEP